jgi:hypothetical protein
MLFRVTCGLGNWRLSVCIFRVKSQLYCLFRDLLTRFVDFFNKNTYNFFNQPRRPSNQIFIFKTPTKIGLM